MNGGGCYKCPVNPCETSIYRGSYCAAQRAEYGLGDPQTNLDRMRFLDFGEIRTMLVEFFTIRAGIEDSSVFDDGVVTLVDDFLEWLQKPAEKPRCTLDQLSDDRLKDDER